MGQRIDLSFQVQGVLPEVNGGAGALTGLHFADAEVPSGTKNGVNTSFTLAFSPSPALSLMFFWKKQLLIQGVDYTLAGNAVSVTAPPLSGDDLHAWYRYMMSGWVISDNLFIQDSPVLGFGMLMGESEAANWVDALVTFLIIEIDRTFAEPPVAAFDALSYLLTGPANVLLVDESLTMTDSVTVVKA